MFKCTCIGHKRATMFFNGLVCRPPCTRALCFQWGLTAQVFTYGEAVRRTTHRRLRGRVGRRFGFIQLLRFHAFTFCDFVLEQRVLAGVAGHKMHNVKRVRPFWLKASEVGLTTCGTMGLFACSFCCHPPALLWGLWCAWDCFAVTP